MFSVNNSSKSTWYIVLIIYNKLSRWEFVRGGHNKSVVSYKKKIPIFASRCCNHFWLREIKHKKKTIHTKGIGAGITLAEYTYRLSYLRDENPKILLVIVDNIFYS